jgi:phytoene dehydrogenase-like protein
MSARAVAIVGAGLGGLSAGCYGQLAGLKTTIYEMHDKPGGLCTAWTRRGYTFDGCIHHLAGCRPGTPTYRMWEELGAMPRESLFPADLTQVEMPEGKVLTVYTDLDRLEAHLLALAPGDGRVTRRYVRALRIFTRFDLFDALAGSWRDWARLFRRAPTAMKWGRLTMRTFAERFRDPFLRQAMATIQYDWPNVPIVLHLNILAGSSVGRYGFPAGGSLRFAQAIADRYLSLGGEIRYRTKVEAILVEKGRAIGVRLADGTEHRADAVISNATAYATLHGLLGGKYRDDRLQASFARPQDEMIMGVHVSFGLARDLSPEPHAMVLWLPKPVHLADRVRDRLDLELFGFDPSLAPPGKGVLRVLLDTKWSHWAELGPDRERYRAEKERLAEEILRLLEPRFPGITGQVEAWDVATPLTTERYTGVGQGFESSPRWGAMMGARPTTVTGVKGLQIVGQSVGGAGLLGCAVMGRNAIRAVA